MGELVAIYDKAAYAIQKAEQVSGVVISSEQSYIWEKGNRDLVYYNEIQPFGLAEGRVIRCMYGICKTVRLKEN